MSRSAPYGTETIITEACIVKRNAVPSSEMRPSRSNAHCVDEVMKLAKAEAYFNDGIT
jgi:hypothetical protein